MAGKRTSITIHVEATAQCAAQRHALWDPGAPLLVGVSGGADSLCLLGTLLALRSQGRPRAPGTLTVAHLDHGLRGSEGQRDAEWVRVFTEGLGLRCVTGSVEVRRIARDEHRSLEDAARRARYTFLREVALEASAQRICVGHTRDDQVETILMHVLRGSGLAGLAGMAPLEGDIARPLLDVSRSDTLAYCAARGWQPRVDPTNANTAFLRNRIRHTLLPSLGVYNPALHRTLAANAGIVAEDERYLETQTNAAWAVCTLEDGPGFIAFALPAVLAQPLALRRRLLRRAVERLTHHQHSLEAVHVAALDDLLAHGATGARLDLPGRVHIGLAYGRIECKVSVESGSGSDPSRSQAHAIASVTDNGTALDVPGAVELPALGWRVRAWQIDQPAGLEPSEPALPATLPPLVHAGTRADLGRAELRVYLDADVAGEALVVRTWRSGDRFQPLGMHQTKKLQDYFADAKVPRDLRHRLPIIVGREHILWVGGQRIDERARLTLATRHILVLQLEPLVYAAQSLQASDVTSVTPPAVASGENGKC